MLKLKGGEGDPGRFLVPIVVLQSKPPSLPPEQVICALGSMTRTKSAEQIHVNP